MNDCTRADQVETGQETCLREKESTNKQPSLGRKLIWWLHNIMLLVEIMVISTPLLFVLLCGSINHGVPIIDSL